MPGTGRHPLLDFLEVADAKTALRSGSETRFIERVEKRAIQGTGKWVGNYRAYYIARDPSGTDTFHCVAHADLGWAVGLLVYRLFRKHIIPVDAEHLSDALFGMRDGLTKQELKSYFLAEWLEGKCIAWPVIEGFDATSPGRYFSVNDYLFTPFESRGTLEVMLRLDHILLPSDRVQGDTRDLTLKTDREEIVYRERGGTRQILGGKGDAGGRSGREILEGPPGKP